MNSLDYRYIARIKLKAETPLFVGSGDASLITDSLVFKDNFGLPMIPGTSLSGVLRHSIEDNLGKSEKWNDLFGYQKPNGDDGRGSRLIVSSAYFVLGDREVVEDLDEATQIDKELLSKLNRLPTRQHVKITHKGVAEKGNLFDHEVLYKGAQFVFEIELKGTEGDKEDWELLIKKIKDPAFRIGQGTRNGFGSLEVKGIFEKSYNLNDKVDFEEYLNFSPSFNSIQIEENENKTESKPADYTLELEPDDFFIFSEGFGDQEVDNKPVTEEIIEYVNGKITFKEKTLIPGSSIKGAIAHRVAYHYNKLNEFFADKINENLKDYLEENNKAVATIFGEKGVVKEVDGKKINIGQRGLLLIDDLYYDDIDNNKIFNHVAIDRFTGGGIDGALFSEKVSYKKDKKITLKINLSKPIGDETIEQSLENALLDIRNGLLPLGGMTTKGFGMFTGTLLKDNIEITNYHIKKAEA